jgi:hypothetical protein
MVVGVRLDWIAERHRGRQGKAGEKERIDLVAGVARE